MSNQNYGFTCSDDSGDEGYVDWVKTRLDSEVQKKVDKMIKNWRDYGKKNRKKNPAIKNS